GLAPVIVEALAAVLLRLRGEGALSIVLVEQNSRVALAFSSRTVVMDKGRIVYDGESSALSADPDRLAALIGVAEGRGHASARGGWGAPRGPPSPNVSQATPRGGRSGGVWTARS